MEDLIASLYPSLEDRKGYAKFVVHDPLNSSRLHAGVEETLPDLQGRASRESTVSWDGDEDERRCYAGSRLQLTFTHGPKASPGFVMGTDSKCDIVLPPIPSISRRHCYLGFDAQRRFLVRDFSTYGTTVKYDGKGEKRRHFTWIIGGHKVANGIGEIVIQFNQDLEFQIVVSKPTFRDLYLEHVNKFLRETTISEGVPFAGLDIQSSASTAAPSGTVTPGQRQDPVLLKQKSLGKGGFSIVTLVWDVSTGFEYASKEFHDVETSLWRKEVAIMRQISHEHMVKLHSVMESPEPQLLLEYLPLGTLAHQHAQRNISEVEVINILQQGLSALDYLHGQSPPIVHRDIKPDNILVQSRDPLIIKLADFGLSKAGENLSTFCGTLTYLAPEVAEFREWNSNPILKYTHTVDIWSFGVVVFQYFDKLPHPGNGRGSAWCQQIVKRLMNWDSDNLIDLLLNMVVIDPSKRWSANKCLKSALALFPGSPTEKQFNSDVDKTPDTAGIAHPIEQVTQATIRAASMRDSTKSLKISQQQFVEEHPQHESRATRIRLLHKP